MLVYAWRRHLAAAVARMEAMGAKDEDLHTVDVTVGFADLVSFTALSNQLDRDQIGDLVEKFEGALPRRRHQHGGRIIKSLGDSVLFVTSDAEAGHRGRRGDHQRDRSRPQDAGRARRAGRAVRWSRGSATSSVRPSTWRPG